MSILRCFDLGASTEVEIAPGGACSIFCERRLYDFAIIPGARFYVDDVELPAVSGADGAVWRWSPGFYAGEVVAELVGESGRAIAEYRLDVAPDSIKLGKDAFDEMVDDLFDFDPRLLIGTESAQFSIGATGTLTDPDLAYARLRRYGSMLISALEEVSNRPLTRLRHERRLVRHHEVRRLDRHALLTAARTPAATAILRPEVAPSNAREVRFDVSHAVEDVDNPANRLIAAALVAVLRRTKQVAIAMQEVTGRNFDDETRTSPVQRAPRRLEYLNSLFASLRRLQRRSPYSSCTRIEVSSAGLNAIAAHPAYARAYKYAWYVLRSGIGERRADETLWVSPTWEVYERWCFLQIVRALRLLFPEVKWTEDYRNSDADSIWFRGITPTGEINLWSQRMFKAWDQSGRSDFRSISSQRCPDIVLTAEIAGKRVLLVFDAKYRARRESILEAMASAHIYHDCLRWKGTPPASAILLIPGGNEAAWLEAEDFRAQHGVGVLRVGPGTDCESLDALLRTALSH